MLKPIKPETVEVTSADLIVKIPLASIAAWAKDKWEVEGERLRIVDLKKFGKAIKSAILAENEVGDNAIHGLIDAAVEAATEDDLPGVEEHFRKPATD